MVSVYFHYKIWRHHRVPPPTFSIEDSHTFKADVGLLIFAWIYQLNVELILGQGHRVQNKQNTNLKNHDTWNELYK